MYMIWMIFYKLTQYLLGETEHRQPHSRPPVDSLQHCACLPFSHSPAFQQHKLALPIFVLYINGQNQHAFISFFSLVADFFQIASHL